MEEFITCQAGTYAPIHTAMRHSGAPDDTDNRKLLFYREECVLLGKKIVELREAKGWKTTELARRASVDQATLWNIEHGNTRNPTGNTLKKVANALGCNLTDLYGQNNNAPVAELLAAYATLPPEHQQAVLNLARALLPKNR